MNKIYDIKLCGADDIDKVRYFIDTQWKKNHALVTSRELLDFQHYENDNYTYNFIIAINILTKEIDGLIGFIPTAHYDKDLQSEGDYWGAIWKVREDVENEEIKTLGLYLFENFKEITSYRTFGAIGISSIAKKIYKALRYQIGTLNQFYIINEQKTVFNIAQIPHNKKKEGSYESSDFIILPINNLIEIKEPECFYKPKKSLKYLIERYQKHPIYHYNFLGIYNNDHLKAVLVIRVIKMSGTKIIRIVDWLGDYKDIPNLYNQMQKFLRQENAEYIDCLNYGISEDIFHCMGFTKLLIEGENIIPTFFEPFERKNIAVEFAFKSANSYMIFKGDSDQDRPNII